MKKTTTTGKGKKEKNFDAAFDKYSSMLSKEYKAQFKTPEYTGTTKKEKLRDAQRKNKEVIVNKGFSNKQKPNVNIADDAEVHIKEVPKEIATQVSKARSEAKMTQDDLAKAISEKTAVIKELESCEGVYKPEVVVKIEKKLKVHFTRSWKKEVK